MFGILSQDSLVKKCLKFIVFFTITLTPLVFSVKHIYFFTPPKYAFLAFAGSICFALLAFYLLEARFLIDKKIKIALGVSASFIVWLFISSFFGVDFPTSFWSGFGRHTGFLTYFFSFIFFIATLFVYDKETFPTPLKAFTIGGTLAALSIYLSPALFGVNLSFLNNSANGGTFGNTTYAAIFLAFSLFSALILFFREDLKNRKWVWLICFFFILFCPIFLNIKGIFTGDVSNIFSIIGEARAGAISILIGLLSSFILYFYFSDKKIISTISKITIVLCFVFVILGAMSLFSSNGKLHNYFLNTKEGIRLIYWDMAMAGIGQRPIFGFGLENFPVMRNKYFEPALLSPQYPIESWADKPHNVILEVAFSAGIPGLILYLSLIGFALFSLIKKISVSNRGDKITASIFFGLFMSYLFQLFFAFDTVSSLLAFFVILAIIFVFCFKDIDNIGLRKLSSYKKSGLIFLLVVLSILLIYFFSFKVAKESKMVRQMNTMSIQKRISVFEKTMNISPVGTLTSESQYIDFLVERYKRDWRTFDEEVKMEVVRELESILKHALERSDQHREDFRFALIPAKAANGLFAASKMKNKSMLEIVKKYGMRAIDNSPASEKGYKIMVEAYVLDGKAEMAMKFAEMLTGLYPKIAEFHNLVIDIARTQKNPKIIADKIKNAQKFIPNYEYGLSR